MEDLISALENKVGAIALKYSEAKSEIVKKDQEIEKLKSSLSSSEEKQSEIKTRLETIIHKLENI